MPRGGPRPGSGGARPGAGRPRKLPPSDTPRPHFASGRDFALWVLNAPDAVAPMDYKLRAMQALLALEGKAPAPEKPAPAAQPPGDLYAPRKVKGFGVVDGGRKPDPAAP